MLEQLPLNAAAHVISGRYNKLTIKSPAKDFSAVMDLAFVLNLRASFHAVVILCYLSLLHVKLSQ